MFVTKCQKYYNMAKTIVTVQSKDKRDIELFFDLLGDNVGKGVKAWEHDGKHTSMFVFDFRALQKNLKSKRVNEEVKIVEVEVLKKKQDLTKNKELEKNIKKYRRKGLSFGKIADKMNAEGFRSSRGNKLNRMTVYRLSGE